MRPRVAHCRLRLGKLYRLTDKRERAQEQLAIATTLYTNDCGREAASNINALRRPTPDAWPPSP